ncbi:MAG: sulfite exporter TauE/SafE family protein [Clostridia bacterium]|nr:sulfite exporter TauE/SafE family protein [Clostridia bacterium]
MKEFLFGIISGIVASMGMGGGVTLVLLFSLFSEVKQHIVQGINLIFFVPTSIVAIYMNIRNKNIDYDVAKTVIVSGVIGAITGSLMAIKINSDSLKKYFGIFLIGIAIFEIFSFFRQYILKEKR